MTNPVPFERRLAKVEADATDALALARGHDRDIAELPLKVDANRRAINALGVQTAERFNQMDESFNQMDDRFNQMDERFTRLERKVDEGFASVQATFDQVDAGFAEMRFKFDQTAAGLAHITDLLERREPDGD